MGKPERLLIRYRREPGSPIRRPADTASATDTRITAILRTIEIERDLHFDHVDWADDHGIARHAL